MERKWTILLVQQIMRTKRIELQFSPKLRYMSVHQVRDEELLPIDRFGDILIGRFGAIC